MDTYEAEYGFQRMDAFDLTNDIYTSENKRYTGEVDICYIQQIKSNYEMEDGSFDTQAYYNSI